VERRRAWRGFLAAASSTPDMQLIGLSSRLVIWAAASAHSHHKTHVLLGCRRYHPQEVLPPGAKFYLRKLGPSETSRSRVSQTMESIVALKNQTKENLGIGTRYEMVDAQLRVVGHRRIAQ
jgi:hypothetical protein